MTVPPSRADLSAGRARQKQRTHNALIAAARELIAQGTTPTVEDAAAAAAISRTTAYRYFRSQAELLAAAHPEIETRSMLPSDAPEDPEARLSLVVERITRVVAETEAQQRAMLRLSLEGADPSSLPLRQGRGIAWLEEALAPLRGEFTPAEVRRLALAVRTAIGIEALVWLTDVARLSRPDALATMRWAAAALLRGARDGKRTPGSSRRRAPR